MRTRGLFSIFLLAAGGALTGAHGCNTYDASLLVGDAIERPPAKGGVGWWSKPDSRGCFSAGRPRPEDRPAPVEGADEGPIVLAISSMRLGSLNEQGVVDANAWQDLGLDLDGVCTASETCLSEDPPPSCKAGASQLPRDGRYCRDNTFGKLEYSAALVPQLAKKYGLSDDAFNCALCVGHYTFLIRITGYNGQPNDDRVRIDLYPSPGLERPLPWSCETSEWVNQPCFTPDMPWTVQADTLVEDRGGPNLPDSRIFSADAFVRDGYLVTELPQDTLFWFPGYKGVVVAYPIRLQHSVVVGKLAKGQDRVWRIEDGIIAGRVRQRDVINGFRLIGFCDTNDKDNYELMSTFVNDNLDILADGRSDPEAPCDAMSMGVAFNALQATAGKTETVAPLVECVIPKTARDAGAEDSGAPDGGAGDGG
ncbi:MAG: hypothetical protein KF850_13305 [Labilithrix sp.]|nr:hypothetical protein [Labilithrix sp.]